MTCERCGRKSANSLTLCDMVKTTLCLSCERAYDLMALESAWFRDLLAVNIRAMRSAQGVDAWDVDMIVDRVAAKRLAAYQETLEWLRGDQGDDEPKEMMQNV